MLPNVTELEIALEKEVYKKSYYQFFLSAFPQIEMGVKFKDNWHVKYLCDRLQAEAERIWRGEKRNKHLIINVPPRSAKSLIVTIIFPAWCWAHNPSMRFITTSFNGDLASEHSQKTKNIINSRWYQRLYGDKVKFDPSTNAKTYYATTEGGERKAVGTGGQITGSGGNIFVLDDPQDPKRAASEKERENCISFFDNTAASRLNDPEIDMFIIVMQRLHEEDLTGYLLTDTPEDFEHICIPAEYDEEMISPVSLRDNYKDGLYFPERFTRRALDGWKKRLKSDYIGQFGQRPGKKEGNIIKRAWFEIVNPEEVTRNIDLEPVHFFIDPAYTEKTTNDPTGLLTCFYREATDTLYVINASQVWKEFGDLIEFIKQYTSANSISAYSALYVEPKASGLSIVQTLSRVPGLNVISIGTDVDCSLVKVDKTTRVNSVSTKIQAGKVKLIKGSWNDEFIGEVCGFPRAKHDDRLDCLCYAIDILLNNDSFNFSFI